MNIQSEEIIERLALSTIAVGLANLEIKTSVGDSNIEIQEKRLDALKNTNIKNYSRNTKTTLFDIVEDYQLALASIKSNIKEKFLRSSESNGISIEETSAKFFDLFDKIRTENEHERYAGQKSIAEFFTKPNEYSKENLTEWILKMVNEQKDKNQYHSELKDVKANISSIRRSSLYQDNRNSLKI